MRIPAQAISTPCLLTKALNRACQPWRAHSGSSIAQGTVAFMGFHDSNQGSVIARLFGRGTSETGRVDAPFEAAEPPRCKQARADLLHQISEFLLRHGLEVSPRNLALAHAAKSGSDLWLCEKVFQREMSGQPITQDWIDSVARAGGDQEALLDSLGEMMDRLEGSMVRFERSTKLATTTTGECRNQFARHMEQVRETAPDAISRRLVDLSQAMLGTLQRIDTEMRRNQAETRELRGELQRARAEANNDHLTRLPNRRAFEERFAQFHEEARANGEPLFVAICDVDHFKRVNDRFGHETGDGLLRAIGNILKRIASPDCFIARHGGEEFVILFKGFGRAEAMAQIEQAQRALKERRFIARRSGEVVGTITFSAGIADVMAQDDPRAALAKADEALYRAKELGRDRVENA